MISYKEQPKLFSIVYGEGVFNDIVSIILFNTVSTLIEPKSHFTWQTPFEILGNFIKLGLISILIGVVIGMLSSLMFKYMRFLTHSPITETLMIMILAFICYYASEGLHQSGIISLLTCGITMAHYTWYNMSPQGKTITSVSVSTYGAAAESFVFVYIGLCVFTYTTDSTVGDMDDHIWSTSFILWMVLIVIFGRLITVFMSHYLFELCGRSDINIREVAFIAWGGMIRGAIAFGLVLKIPDTSNEPEKPNIFTERGVIVTTTLALVIITTLFFGTFMKLVQKILFS